MRTSALASALVLLVSGFAHAGPREELDLGMRVTGRTGAHDVVEAAGVGLTVALLAHQRQPRVLRAERVAIDGEMLWRVDVAGQDGDGFGCSAIAAWIAEDGRVVRLGKVTEIGPLSDCSQWYFDGDTLAIEAAHDFDPRDALPAPPPLQYRSTPPWGDVHEGWNEWIREIEEYPEVPPACEETGDCEGW